MGIKRFTYLAIVFVFIFSVSFLQAQEHHLTVQNGLGSGDYAVGEVVDIVAATPVSQVFASWTGDSVNVSYPEYNKTTVLMPDRDITVIPTFDTAPSGTQTILGTVTGDIFKGLIIVLYDKSGAKYHYTVSDSNGNYAFSGLGNGIFKVYVQFDERFHAEPYKISLNIDNANIGNVDFETTSNPYITNSGRISYKDETPIAGVLIRTQDGHCAITNYNGYYVMANLTPETDYTITPELTGHKFFPETRSIKTQKTDNDNSMFKSFSFEGAYSSYCLTVTDGTGSGEYIKDSTISVSADIPANRVFSKWSGDTQYVADVNASTTTIQMPAENIAVKPLYEDAPQNTYSISGRISADIKAGVAVVADTRHSAVTDKDGNYTINGLSNGSYTVTPQLDNYSFNPASTPQTISDASVSGVDFVSTSLNYTITGKIIDETGSGIENASLFLNTGLTGTTDSEGVFSITGVPSGTYSISCKLSGYSFMPSQTIISVKNKDLKGIYFIASPSHSLTVEDGFGSGEYVRGFQQTIAPRIPSGKAFKAWSGDTQYLSAPDKELVLVNMPSKDITIRPIFEDAPIGTYTLSGTLYGKLASNTIIYAKKDAESHFTVTDDSGDFVVSGLENGDYELKIAQSLYMYKTLKYVHINGANADNVRLTYNGFKIEGSILNEYYEPVPGVTLTNGLGAYAMTDSNGQYSFLNITNYQTTIISECPGYTFHPQKLQVFTYQNASDYFCTAYKTQQFALTALDSVGGGLYASNAKIKISANVPVGKEFKTWTGDTLYVKNLNSASTIVSMPAKDIVLIPSFADAPDGTYELQGKVTGDVVSGVLINVDAKHSAITGMNGEYTISGLADGATYSIEPSFEGYSFSPASASVTIASGNENGVDFISGGNSFSISGTVIDEQGQKVEGLTLEAGIESGTTDSEGNFTIGNLSDRTYNVKLNSSSYELASGNSTVVIDGKNQEGLHLLAKKLYSLTVHAGIGSGNYPAGKEIILAPVLADDEKFTAWEGDYQYLDDRFASKATLTMPSQDITIDTLPIVPPLTKHIVSGHVSGVLSVGIIIKIQDHSSYESTYTATNSMGDYYCACDPGTYTISMELDGYLRTPKTIVVNVVDQNISGQDFTTSSNFFNIRGIVQDDEGDPINSFVMTDGHGKVAKNYNSGFFVFLNEPARTYTLTPYLPGFTFIPSFRKVNITHKTPSVQFFSIFKTEDKILTVTDGMGSGEYNLGESVSIAADSHDGEIFTHWSGDTRYISDVNASSTTVKMPPKNIKLTAEFIATPENTYTISGHISGDVLQGVVVSTDSTHSGTSDADGAYQIKGLAKGEYMVIAKSPGCTFAPGVSYINISDSNFTDIDFTSTFNGFMASGTVLDLSGNGVAGVLITSDNGVSDITGANGRFVLRGLPNGVYTINASISSKKIIQPSMLVEINNQNIGDLIFNTQPMYSLTVNNGTGSGLYLNNDQVNIIATVPKDMIFDKWIGDTGSMSPKNSPSSMIKTLDHDITVTAQFTSVFSDNTVSGKVEGDFKKGVTVALTGSKNTFTATNENGEFFFSSLPDNSSYSVTLILPQTIESTPYSRAVNISTSNISGVNFYTTDKGLSISGSISHALPGVLVKADDAHYAYTAANGDYKIEGLSPNKIYNLTPHINGCSFFPSSKPIYLKDESITKIDFRYHLNKKFNLEVVNGTGSSLCLANERVKISALIPEGFIFKQWAGDIQFLDKVHGASTTVTMPSKNIILTAEFAPAPPNAYSIIGKISGPQSLIEGVSVTLDSGELSLTDAGGNYKFTGLPNGTYNVTPTADGCEFAPTSFAAVVNDSNVENADFALSFNGYSISGKVTDPSGVPKNSVNLTIDSQDSTTTDPNGNYMFTNLSNGYHTITVSFPNYTFAPKKTTLFINGRNRSEIDFVCSRSYGLTINNGFGSGRYAKGELIEIVPTIPDGMFFSHWSGDTQYINNPTSNATVLMPALDISLTANFTNAQAGTHKISGSLSGDIVNDVVICLMVKSTGVKKYTTTVNGNYSFSNLQNDDYLVIPQLNSYNNQYTSSPYSQSVSIADNNVSNINFNTRFQGYTLSGKVEDEHHTQLAGVLITADPEHCAVSKNDGSFSISGLSLGSYELIASLNKYKFTPEFKTIIILNSSISNLTFVGTLKEYFTLNVVNGSRSGSYIEGEVVDIAAATPYNMVFKEWTGDISLINNSTSSHTTMTMPHKNITVKALFESAPENTHSITGILSGDISEGVLISLNSGQTTVTDANGNFTISGLTDGNYTATPTLDGYSFSPISQQVTISGSDVSNIDFSSTEIGYNISGTVLNENGTGVDGVFVSADSTHSATTDADGNFTISGLANGIYNIIPEKTNFAFSPSSQKNIVVNGGNIDNIYFASETAYTLTVNNGTNSGVYPYNKLITISAIIPPGMKFDAWTGDIETLSDKTDTTPFMTMPDKNISVTAHLISATPGTYRISGTVNGDVRKGVIMKLHGDLGLYIDNTTDENGHYVFSDLPNDSYSIQIANRQEILKTCKFTPQNRKIIVAASDVDNVDFNIIKIGRTIAGTIYDDEYNALAGVVVSVDNTYTSTTNIYGYFRISGLTANSHSVTPSLDGFDFTPHTKNINTYSYSVSELHFTGSPKQSCSVTVNNGSGSGSYPKNKSISISATVQNGQIFKKWTGDTLYVANIHSENTNLIVANENITITAVCESIPNNRSISGSITGDVKQGVTVAVDATHSATTDAAGNYTITGLTNNTTYTVTPTLLGCTFNPTDKNVPIANSDVDNIDFVSTQHIVAKYTLTVNNGTGSGQYPENKIVTISATVPPGKTFDKWTGDTQYLANAANASTTVTMSVNNITLTATFKQPAPNTYSISGTVSGDVSAGVTVAVDATHSATTNANGEYTISDLVEGTYTVTPTLAGYSFSPPSNSVRLPASNISNVDFVASNINTPEFTLTVNNGTGGGQYAENATATISATVPAGQVFNAWIGDIQYIADTTAASTTVTMPAKAVSVTATFKQPPPNTHSISGTVTGDISAGVTVAVDAIHSATTNANGEYTISGLPDGSYTVTPTLAGYIFTPTSTTETLAGSDISDIDFVASNINTPEFTLTVNNGTGGGQYAENATAIISATVPTSQVFDAWIGDIQYIADTTAASTIVTMPAKAVSVTATFKPAPPNTHSISGTISGDVLSGVTVAVDAIHSSTTDLTGSYTISGLIDGNYIITPILAGYTFSPVSATETLAGADVENVDFTATAVAKPVAVDDSYNTEIGRELTITPAAGVLTNDLAPSGSDLTAVLENDVTNGTLELNSDGSFTYTPTKTFSGMDSFTYFASNTTAESDTPATVTINVSVQKVTIGVTVTILPSQIPNLIPGTKFDKVPKIYGFLNDKKIGMKKVKESTPDLIKAVWKKKIPLHDKIKTNYAAAINGINQNLEIQLKVKGKVDGDKLDTDAQKILLVPPTITSFSILDNSITVNGLFFGTKAPKLMLEPAIDGKIVKCKVDKKSYTFEPLTGLSSLSATFKTKKAAPGDYWLIIDNKIGIGVKINPDGSTTIPRITIQPPPAPAP